MEKKKYKDKCDECKKFDFCQGYNGKVLCEKCIAKIKQQ
mgnify:CR=1 FL=1|jgi:hypothetical protein